MNSLALMAHRLIRVIRFHKKYTVLLYSQVMSVQKKKLVVRVQAVSET